MPDGFPERALFNKVPDNPYQVITEALCRLWEMPKAGARRMINSWKPEDRAFVFQNVDSASDVVKHVMFKHVFYSLHGPRDHRPRFVKPVESEFFRQFDLSRCLLCQLVFHRADREPGYPFCRPCGKDLQFIHGDLDGVVRKIKAGENIA